MQVTVDELRRRRGFPGAGLVAPVFAGAELRIRQGVEFRRDTRHLAGRDRVAQPLQAFGGDA